MRRLPDDPAAAIAAAEALNAQVDGARAQTAPRPAASSAAEPRTVDALILRYRTSDLFRSKAPATRRGYDQCLEKIRAWAGPAPVTSINWARIEKLMAALSATPAFCNAVVRVLRIILGFAVKLGWLLRNPAERQGLPPSGLIWPREAVAGFVAVADGLGRHSIGTAVMLNEWIGQRQGDVLRLPRSIWRSGNLAIRQSKTGAGVSLPISRVPAIAARIEEEIARIESRGWSPAPAQLIVDELQGRAYRADHFRHLFAAIRAELARATPYFEVDYLTPGRDMADPAAFRIATTSLQFLHLRHTAVTRLAEAGCEIPLISAVTGHSPKSVQEIITRYLVRTRAQAALAFDRRLAAEREPAGEADASEKGR